MATYYTFSTEATPAIFTLLWIRQPDQWYGFVDNGQKKSFAQKLQPNQANSFSMPNSGLPFQDIKMYTNEQSNPVVTVNELQVPLVGTQQLGGNTDLGSNLATNLGVSQNTGNILAIVGVVILLLIVIGIALYLSKKRCRN